MESVENGEGERKKWKGDDVIHTRVASSKSVQGVQGDGEGMNTQILSLSNLDETEALNLYLDRIDLSLSK